MSSQNDRPFWQQSPFWVTCLFAPLIYLMAIIVLWPANNYDNTARVMVITAIVAALGGIIAYWLAASHQADKKDDATIAAVAPIAPAPPPISNTINNSPGENK